MKNKTFNGFESMILKSNMTYNAITQGISPYGILTAFTARRHLDKIDFDFSQKLRETTLYYENYPYTNLSVVFKNIISAINRKVLIK